MLAGIVIKETQRQLQSLRGQTERIFGCFFGWMLDTFCTGCARSAFGLLGALFFLPVRDAEFTVCEYRIAE